MKVVLCCKSYHILYYLWILFVIYLSSVIESRTVQSSSSRKTTALTTTVTQKICVAVEKTMKGKQKICFLRPDTGPCRADIIQWYFDVKQTRCYRFFWGGCQGNGNRFSSREDCIRTCYVRKQERQMRDSHFCHFPFDYGKCFGYFNRWYYDKDSGTCKVRVYSGCGGNQNNFQTKTECLIACLKAPNETLGITTCVPIKADQIN